MIIQSNLCLFFIAGHDTTANTISFAIYYLAKYPEIQQRAREEARSILGDSPKNIIPTVEDTKKMDYINQIIKEVCDKKKFWNLELNTPTCFVDTPNQWTFE